MTPARRVPVGGDSTVERAKEHINANYADAGLSLRTVARAVYASPYHLSRLFAAREKKSFVAYVNEVRVGRAKELLAAADEPVHVVAEMVGYSSPSYFCNVFKKLTGVTPGSWRKLCR